MKIAIIGASGHWAYALNELKNHTVTGICAGFSGEDMSGVSKTLTDNGIIHKIYNNFDEILENEPEIAIINTRFDLNAAYTKKCLEKDIYVFSEKPLALTFDELEEIKKVKTKAFVSCMFGISYEGWCKTIKEAVKNIGTVRMINGRKSYKIGIRPDFYKSKETFGGIVPWVGIHAIHWMHFVTGLKFKECNSTTSDLENFNNGDLETCAAVTFLMENGAIGIITCDYYRPQSASTWDDDRLRVVGTKGIVEYEKGRVFLIDEKGEKELPLLNTDDVFKLFVDRINDGVSGVSMEESIYVTEIALKCK